MKLSQLLTRILFFSDSSEETASNFEDSFENVPSFQSQYLEQDLASWATKNKCTRSALNDLLVILRKQGHRLPKDARTLLRTPRTVEIAEKCGGKYFVSWFRNWSLKASLSKH